jgi:hypothetical protein
MYSCELFISQKLSTIVASSNGYGDDLLTMWSLRAGHWQVSPFFGKRSRACKFPFPADYNVGAKRLNRRQIMAQQAIETARACDSTGDVPHSAPSTGMANANATMG